MGQSVSTCYRHLDRAAKRKCFHCKETICPECQVTLDKHVFCGEECHRAWLAKREKNQARRAAAAAKKKAAAQKALIPETPAILPAPPPIPVAPVRLEDVRQVVSEAAQANAGLVREEIHRLAWSVEVLRGQLQDLEREQRETQQKLRDHDQVEKSRLKKIGAPLALVCLLLGGAYFVRAMTEPSSSPPPAVIPAAVAYEIEAPSSLLAEPWADEAPELQLPVAGREIEVGRISLYGTAPGAVEARLFLNGEWKATALVEGGEFSFPEVALAPGVNALQVEAADPAGRKRYSLARFLERISRRVAKVPDRQGLNFMRGPRSRAEMVLTFDAGSTDRQALAVLDVLKDKGIITTVFLTGTFIEKYPAVVRRIVADGHEVGNHTWSHPHLTTWETDHRHRTLPGVTRESFQQELTRTAELYARTAGQPMAGWWRAPYGEHNVEIRRWAEEAGFKHVDWTRGPNGKNYDMLDWVTDPGSRHYLNRQAMYAQLVGLDDGAPGGANGGIVLMHLGSDRRQDLPSEMLPQAIDALRAKGYSFVTVSQLFRD